MREIVDRLRRERNLPRAQMRDLLLCEDAAALEYLHAQARAVREEAYGRDVYIRALVEFTNFCKNDCLYCGIRRSNHRAQRYRLSQADILACAQKGYALGFRTVVLQGGEDPHFTDARLCAIVRDIRALLPDVAITLSVGERPEESYRALFAAGANRYLLRHETANAAHYAQLHPAELSLEHRMGCLKALKAIGFQTGCGFMVGSPGQTVETLLDDLAFTAALNPEMVGLGPFIPHADTPFAAQPPGTVEQTLKLLSIVRLMLPRVLLPATTALATLDPMGCEKGMLAGANVVMPNLTPPGAREKYLLYDGKAVSGSEDADALEDLRARMRAIGYQIVTDRGDYRAAH